MRKTMMMMMAASALLAATAAHAQWVNQLLNQYAVTNESGQMIILWDEGGYYQDNPQYGPDKSFDGNAGTFYDGDGGGAGGWVGFELQSPKLITGIRYVGRGGQLARIMGVRIQGANAPDFSDAVTLHTLYPPPDWNPTWWRDEQFPSPAVLQPFSYVRFIALPGMAGGNLCMVEFYGADPLPEEAPVPDAPDLTFDACINHRMNLFWTSAPSNAIFYEIQRKIEHEPHFSPLTRVFAVTGEQHFFDDSLLLYRDTTYRIRAVNGSGTSPWVYVAATPLNSGRGQWIGLPGSWENNPIYAGDKVFDGNIATCYNSPGNIQNGTWTGLDFGAAREMTLLRYVPRRNFADRMDGGWFEVADDPDFTTPTGVHTNIGTPPITAITEASFPPPAPARYARYCGPDGSYGNIAEVEFVLADQPPLPPNGLAVSGSDITNDFALLTWTLHDAGSPLSPPPAPPAPPPRGPP
ncbi:MAG: discoidin domain-containing protein, partial [Kiritimatiellaeota bacterium]|nr:discoidin domain-containing protein [Kiritimatiellota bacterium]